MEQQDKKVAVASLMAGGKRRRKVWVVGRAEQRGRKDG